MIDLTRQISFNNNLKNLEGSIIRSLDAQMQNIPNMIRLTLGQPHFNTPEHIKTRAVEALEKNLTTYTPSQGTPELLQAARHFMKEKYEISYDDKTEILTTNGATEALTASLITLINPGDKVVIPSPYFSLYESIVEMAGGVPIFIDTSKTDFMLEPSDIHKVLSKHQDVTAIILNFPNNPTGVTWTNAECEAIAGALRQYPHVCVVSDEIYSEFVYEGGHVSIGRYLKEQSIVINGLSKSHAMTGWRIGFTFAPDWITKEIMKVHQYLVTNVNSIAQYAAAYALTDGIDDAIPMKEAYQERRDLLCESLQRLGFTIAKPNGAFYVFAKLPGCVVQDSMKFTLDLAAEARVAVVPGIAFGESGEGYIRLSYAADIDVLKESIRRIEKYIKGGRANEQTRAEYIASGSQ